MTDFKKPSDKRDGRYVLVGIFVLAVIVFVVLFKACTEGGAGL